MSMFKAGDKVRLKSGNKFSNGEEIATIEAIKEDVVSFTELNTWAWFSQLELASIEYPNPPHKHRDLIIEWANGADIQLSVNREWVHLDNPTWASGLEYRVKPQKTEKDLEIESIQKQMDELKERLEKLKTD